MSIFGHPPSSCLGQVGQQKSWNLGSPMSGQSGLSSLVPKMGNGYSPHCSGPCREMREDEETPRSQRGPCRKPSPPGATFSDILRGLWLAPGRLQEQGPDPAMLRANSTAELSNCPLSAQDNSEQGALPQWTHRASLVSRPQYLTAGLHLSSHCHSPPTPNPDSPCSA